MTSPEEAGGAPYAGPPSYVQDPPPQYPPTQYPPPQYPPTQYPPTQHLPYGPPPPVPPGWGWTPPPGRPQTPAAVIAAAVVAFLSAMAVLLGTLYAAAFDAALSLARGPGGGLGGWVVALHVVLAGLLVTGGVRLLRRDVRWLLGAAVLQLGLCGYWFLELGELAPASFVDTARVLPLLFVALAALAGGLPFLPDGRAWTARPPAAPAAGG